MKSTLVVPAALVALLALTPLGNRSVVAADDDIAAEYASLQAADSQDGNAWYLLSAKARNAGDTETAWKAIAQADELGFSPIRVGFEKMKIAIFDDQPEIAEAELQKIADSGFNSVQVFVNDETISKLAGREKYDEIVAAMTLAAYPCEHTEGFRDFDFWIGEWDVHVAGGQLVGHNSIKSAERGCMLIENWTQLGGGTGTSINYLDRASNEWVQVWNAEGGTQINIRGGLTDEGMALEGYIHYVASGDTRPFKALWTPLDDGRVRQYFEESFDGGETFQPWFEGFYTRKEKAQSSP